MQTRTATTTTSRAAQALRVAVRAGVAMSVSAVSATSHRPLTVAALHSLPAPRALRTAAVARPATLRAARDVIVLCGSAKGGSCGMNRGFAMSIQKRSSEFQGQWRNPNRHSVFGYEDRPNPGGVSV